MAGREGMIAKITEADRRIADLERIASQEKADTQSVVQDLAVQLRYQRRIQNIIQNGPPPPYIKAG